VTTRFYFTNSAASYTPAIVRGAFTSSTLAATNTYALSKTKAGASIATSAVDNVTTNPNRILLHRHVSGPLAGGSVTAGSAPYTHTQARSQSATAATMTVFIHIWFTVGNTDTLRATYVNSFVGSTAFATTLTAFSYNSGTATAVTIQQGDRMVIEMGFNAANTGGSGTPYTGTLQIGGTAADLATTGTTGVTTNSPWIEWPAGSDAALADYTPPAATDNSLLLPVTYGRYRPLLVR
jgi:hypothetical protein